MDDWMETYAELEDPNLKYELLREQATELRGQREQIEFFDRDEVGETVRKLNEQVHGNLFVFVANDFGQPMAYRPKGAGFELQDAVRRAILEGKYDDSHSELINVRDTILDTHPEIHKVIVAEIDGSEVRYHLPEGSNETTNFLTVREMVGLVDYTTNSDQCEGLSKTYEQSA